MEMLVIEGGHALNGQVDVSGAKNSALPVLIATLLCEEKSRLSNVPDLADTRFLLTLIESFGAKINWDEQQATIDACSLDSSLAHYDMVRKMRASVLVLAPLLARKGHAEVSLPGGCAIGSRPVDIHLEGLRALGAHIDVKEGYIHAHLPHGHFVGATYELPMPSVGATEQLIMAAVLAQGNTILQKVAREPEVVELCLALNQAGAKIEGHGTSTLKITGVKKLSGLNYTIKPDRIEAGTFIALVAACKGQITLNNVYYPDIENICERFQHAGVDFKLEPKNEPGFFAMHITAPARLKATDVETQCYPGFPTDMQAQFMAAMAFAEGTSIIHERIFENRMMHVPELCRMGADITVERGVARVTGKAHLTGAQVMATDLRASASLVIAALAASGRSEIRRVYHLDRGYEALEKKLTKLGARIERVAQL